MIYPVRLAAGRRPVISQPFKARQHLGVDIMWPRLPADPPYSATDPRGTQSFVALPGAVCVAARPGKVIYAKTADNGHRVRLAAIDGSHLLYLHLADLRVKAGDVVDPGAELGLMGGDPTGADPHHTVHLHFERRVHVEDSGDGWGMGPVDPQPWLAMCVYV